MTKSHALSLSGYFILVFSCILMLNLFIMFLFYFQNYLLFKNGIILLGFLKKKNNFNNPKNVLQMFIMFCLVFTFLELG